MVPLLVPVPYSTPTLPLSLTPHTLTHMQSRTHTHSTLTIMIHGDLSRTTQSSLWKRCLLQALPVIGVKPTFHLFQSAPPRYLSCAKLSASQGGVG